MIEKGPTIYTGGGNFFSGPSFKVITLNGSATQAFPSGLVRYDRTYVVEKKNAQAARELFQAGNLLYVGTNPEPGAGIPFIFPDPKEVNDVPGFIKFVVTAYSDSANVEFRETFNQQQVNLSKGFSASIQEEVGEPPVNYSWSVLEKYLVDSVTTSGVAPSGTGSPAGSPRILNYSLIRRIVSGVTPPAEFGGGQTSLEISWLRESVSIVRRNFGRWTEYDHTETLIPYY
jgi:hypothetical protein